jgi:hypothetical protein
VSTPTFTPPERRSFLVPLLLALLVLATGAFILIRVFPHTTAKLNVPTVAVLPTRTTFGSASSGGGIRMLGSAPTEDDLYIVPTVRITNDLRVPLFLKDFTLSYTDAGGSEQTASAVENQDFAVLLKNYTPLRTLAEHPLLRETTIAPGQTATGTLIVHLATDAATWQKRQSAVLHIALYHQPDLTVDLPANEAVQPVFQLGAGHHGAAQ